MLQLGWAEPIRTCCGNLSALCPCYSNETGAFLATGVYTVVLEAAALLTTPLGPVT
jgi:hypothetical protein